METITKSSTLATTVVSNDTQKAAITASATTQVAASLLLDMEQKRQNWETTVYRTSNSNFFDTNAVIERLQQRFRVMNSFEASRYFFS